MSAKRYFLLHKPYGCLSQFTPEPGSQHKTLAEFFPVPGMYPVGRLDWDSEGLLLLTNDGPLQHRLTDPRYAHPRTYWVQVEGTPPEEALEELRQGIQVQDYRTRPARVRRLQERETVAIPPRVPPVRYRAAIPTTWLELELTEGRNRQVRRMTAAVGYPTLRLIRVRSGEFRLDGLKAGEWREITRPKTPRERGNGRRGNGR